MAKNMQPIAKRCHALGISPAVMGYAKKTTHRNPGSQMRRKKGEYALQLQEKQKVKFVYGILEKQFRSYYEKATRMEGPSRREPAHPGGAPPGQRGVPPWFRHHPPRRPPAGHPRPLHRKRQEGGHPLYLVKVGGRHRGEGLQPLLCEVL